MKISASTLANWMQEDFPDTSVCPHKSDYCSSCFEFNASLESLQTQMNLHKVFLLCYYTITDISLLLQQNNNANQLDLLQATRKEIEAGKEAHIQQALDAIQYMQNVSEISYNILITCFYF